MKSPVEAVCPSCGTRIQVPYTLLGAATACPSCGERVVPQVAVGTSYPRTDYQMTFSDFHQLVTTKAYRSSVGELLLEWYGYRVVGDGDSSAVLSRGGENVDLLELHQQIQGDSLKQRALYGTAMTLWR